jgi:hypothetical protein
MTRSFLTDNAEALLAPEPADELEDADRLAASS